MHLNSASYCGRACTFPHKNNCFQHHYCSSIFTLRINKVAFVTTQNVAGTFVEDDTPITGVIPEWKGQFVVDWRYHDFTTSLNIEYLGAVEESFSGHSVTNKIDAQWYVDPSSRYEFDMGLELALGVTNVFDNKPPLIAHRLNIGATDVDTYRPLGRSWFANVRYQF